MRSLNPTSRALAGYSTDYVRLLVAVPVAALAVLAVVGRVAAPAADPARTAHAVAAQLQERLSEIRRAPDAAEKDAAENVAQKEEAEAASVAATRELVRRLEPAADHSPNGPRQSVHHIRRNETLATILQKEDLSPSQFAPWLYAARNIDKFKKLQLGHAMTLSYDQDHAGVPTLRTVSYNIDNLSSLVLERRRNGRIESRVEQRPTERVWRTVRGSIRTNLYTAATKLGVPPRIIDDLADMDWSVNFYALRPGATFKIVFEEAQSDGVTISPGRLLAAEIANNGKTYTAFALEPGKRSRVQGDGSLFVYPVRFTRISSVYRDARFHPIYKRNRPHRGVDFAAPTGTPVRAAAAGEVTYAGWKGNYGRLIKIRHAAPYSTAYAHLRRIEKGIRVGTRVTKGQTIGYVGSSGAATGPHLHFEMRKNGRFVDPLKEKAYAKKIYQQQRRAGTPQLAPKLAALKRQLTECLASLDGRAGPVNRVYTASPRAPAARREAA